MFGSGLVEDDPQERYDLGDIFEPKPSMSEEPNRKTGSSPANYTTKSGRVVKPPTRYQNEV